MFVRARWWWWWWVVSWGEGEVDAPGIGVVVVRARRRVARVAWSLTRVKILAEGEGWAFILMVVGA